MTEDNELNVQEAILIQQMRIYDVLFAILVDARPDMAAQIKEAHDAGDLLGPMPFLGPITAPVEHLDQAPVEEDK